MKINTIRTVIDGGISSLRLDSLSYEMRVAIAKRNDDAMTLPIMEIFLEPKIDLLMKWSLRVKSVVNIVVGIFLKYG